MSILVKETMATSPVSGTVVTNATPSWNASGWYQLTTGINQYANLEYNAAIILPFTMSVDMQITSTSGADSSWFYFGCSTTPQTEGDSAGIGYVLERNDFDSNIRLRYGGSALTAVAWTKDINFDTLRVEIDHQTFAVYYQGTLLFAYTDPTIRTLPGNKFGFGARCGGTGNGHYIKNLQVTDANHSGEYTNRNLVVGNGMSRSEVAN